MNSSGYGASAGQRLPAQYEAPACVQNAMMTKDKKPFTYTPGGIDLSQIKSERMAKRLARNAQSEGATGSSQLNRPTPPPPPPPSAPQPTTTTVGKIPPPPPPLNATLAPPTTNGNSKPGSPSAPRKSPTPQNFQPPPLGFRPEIKIPANPMAALRKVPPPVEKNHFWKDEYVKERSKSPMVGENDRGSSPNNVANYAVSESPNSNSNNNNNVDGFKKSTIPTNTQQPETNNYNNNNTNYNTNYNNQQYATPIQQQQQQSPMTPQQQQYQQYQAPQQQYTPTPPPIQQQQQQYTPTPPPQTPQQQLQQLQQQQFRSVPTPQSPAINVYTRQTDSPRADAATPPQRVTESPFRFAQQQQQQQQQQQRSPAAISPLAQQQQPSPIQQQQQQQPQTQAQTVPWRAQRNPQSAAQAQPQQQQQQQEFHPQPIYNNVPHAQQQQQQPQQRDIFSPNRNLGAQNYCPPQQQQQQQQQPEYQYQGPKPTNVGSLYIAPLAPPTEPQAQNIVRQQMLQQQQQQQRDSPMRQLSQQQPPQPQQQQQQQRPATARWMTAQPAAKEQPEWARADENSNVLPSSLQRIKSPPPPQMQRQVPQQQAPQLLQQQQQQQPTAAQGNGYAAAPTTYVQNFGAHANAAPTGLRLQITATAAAPNQSGPKERIIPIQLEQTPTYTPTQPNFNTQQAYGSNNAPTGYVIRSPNQFVDQGYNNYPAGQQQQLQQQQQREQSVQRVLSPTQQLNAPRIIQQQQQQQTTNNVAGNRTRIIPIAIEGGDGTRGPISQSPIVIQNDPRTPPVQSKSFRILQKITDTIDDGTATSNGTAAPTSSNNDSFVDAEPQLQRPQFARQMSAQQARNSPTVDQMRRMQITQQEQQQQNKDTPQPYIHPSEQQVPEPKKYTGSAIPSRSFKILQAMTTPENAGPGQSDL